QRAAVQGSGERGRELGAEQAHLVADDLLGGIDHAIERVRERGDRTLIGAVRLELHGPVAICTRRARKRSPTSTRPLSGRRAVCRFYDVTIRTSAGSVAGRRQPPG